MQGHRCGARVGGLRGGDLAIFEHGIDHQIATLLGAVGMIDRGIVLRRLGETGQQSASSEVNFFAGLLK